MTDKSKSAAPLLQFLSEYYHELSKHLQNLDDLSMSAQDTNSKGVT